MRQLRTPLFFVFCFVLFACSKDTHLNDKDLEGNPSNGLSLQNSTENNTPKSTYKKNTDKGVSILDLRDLDGFENFMTDLKTSSFSSLHDKAIEVFSLMQQEYQLALSTGNTNPVMEPAFFEQCRTLAKNAYNNKANFASLDAPTNWNKFLFTGDESQANQYLLDVLFEEHNLTGMNTAIEIAPPSSNITEIVTIGGFTDGTASGEIVKANNPTQTPITNAETLIVLGLQNGNVIIGYYSLFP